MGHMHYFSSCLKNNLKKSYQCEILSFDLGFSSDYRLLSMPNSVMKV